MKKLLLFSVFGGIFLGHSNAFARTCDYSYENKEFYSASISKNKSVRCSYRYCYYTCSYDSYDIRGPYKPGRGAWEKMGDYDVCYTRHSNCQFELDWNNNKKQK